MRTMFQSAPRVILSLWLWLIPYPAKAFAETLRVAVISNSANNWPLFVAEDKGFFRDAGVQVELMVTGDSAKQLEGLARGDYEITHQAADQFVRAIEGGKDFVIFMTISRPIFDFIVKPEIRTFNDLRGKTIALDRLTTGYWLLFRKVLAENGLKATDYHLQPDSGGPENRLRAVQEGRAQATYLNPPQSTEAISKGLKRLTGLADHFPNFPGSSGGARRIWAKQHEETLVAYLRAYIRAVSWLSDPTNHGEAIAIFRKRVDLSPEALADTYETFVRVGMVPAAEINRDGMQLVLELMADDGLLSPPLPSMEKYANPEYQQKALGSLKGP